MLNSLSKIFPVVRIFSYTIITYLKWLVRAKSLDKKQCPARLPLRNILSVSSLLPKVSLPLILLCCPHDVLTVPLSPNFCGKIWIEWKSHQTAKQLLTPPTWKISLNKFTFSHFKSVLPSLSNSNFYVITE